MPVAAVHIHDNWQVMGLQGTGSCDFSVTDLFVPEPFSWDAQRARPQRGGPLYRLGMPAFVANEHVAFALGVGQRAPHSTMLWARVRCGCAPSALSPLSVMSTPEPSSVRGRHFRPACKPNCGVSRP